MDNGKEEIREEENKLEEKELYFDNFENMTHDYNEGIDDSSKILKSGDEMIDEMLKDLKEQFVKLKSSPRGISQIPAYAESIASLIKAKNQIQKDLVNFGEKKLTQNIKLKALYVMYKDHEKDKTGEKPFNPLEFNKSLENMFDTTK